MSILIKGKEMPKTCCACFCARDNKCGITRYEPTFAEWYEDGVKDCPLVPVPPHGDLIDRREAIIDANERAYDFWNCDADVDSTVSFLNEQPTIIEEER